MFRVHFYKWNKHVKEHVFVALRMMAEEDFYKFYSSADYEIVNFENGVVHLRYAEEDGDVPNRFITD